jgi:hypothetical protein
MSRPRTLLSHKVPSSQLVSSSPANAAPSGFTSAASAPFGLSLRFTDRAAKEHKFETLEALTAHRRSIGHQRVILGPFPKDLICEVCCWRLLEEDLLKTRPGSHSVWEVDEQTGEALLESIRWVCASCQTTGARGLWSLVVGRSYERYDALLTSPAAQAPHVKVKGTEKDNARPTDGICLACGDVSDELDRVGRLQVDGDVIASCVR